jgi:hypothetical protein
MNGTGYKLLGLIVWRGGKWYVRRRLPSRRALALSVLAATVGVSVLALIARRTSG